MDNHQHAGDRREADGDEARGSRGIDVQQVVDVFEDRERFFECDTMLLEIGGRLGVVPLVLAVDNRSDDVKLPCDGDEPDTPAVAHDDPRSWSTDSWFVDFNPVRYLATSTMASKRLFGLCTHGGGPPRRRRHGAARLEAEGLRRLVPERAVRPALIVVDAPHLDFAPRAGERREDHARGHGSRPSSSGMLSGWRNEGTPRTRLDPSTW